MPNGGSTGENRVLDEHQSELATRMSTGSGKRLLNQAILVREKGADDIVRPYRGH